MRGREKAGVPDSDGSLKLEAGLEAGAVSLLSLQGKSITLGLSHLSRISDPRVTRDGERLGRCWMSALPRGDGIATRKTEKHRP